MSTDEHSEVLRMVQLILQGMGCSEHLQQLVCVRWSKRMNSSFARAGYVRALGHVKQAEIAISEDTWRHCCQEERMNTLVHECAHLAVVERDCVLRRKDSQPHGPEWKQVMLAAGYEPAIYGIEPEERAHKRMAAMRQELPRVTRWTHRLVCSSCGLEAPWLQNEAEGASKGEHHGCLVCGGMLCIQAR